MLTGLAACSLPRGAALQSEILSGQNAQERSFSVVPVTREMTTHIAKWPATGWSGGYRWLTGNRGPEATVIQAGDRLNVTVWDNQENSLLTNSSEKLTSMQGLTVSPSGTVFLPYVGDIVVRGLTEKGARERIQNQLEKIVPDAQVQVSVEPGNNNSVDLVSGVQGPGRVPLANRNTKILSALAQGGGISEALRHPLVRLQRGGNSYEIRADRLFSQADKNIVLRGGDQILVVEDDRYFTAMGASGKEEIIYFEKESMSAMDALSAMGGLNDTRADPKGVLVLREYATGQLGDGINGPEMEQVIFTIDLTTADGLFAARKFEVNPLDTIVATESAITKARTVLGLVGTVLGISNQLDDD